MEGKKLKKIGIIVGLSMSVIMTGCFNHHTKEASSDAIQQAVVEPSTIIEVEGKVIAKNKRDIYIDFPAVVQELYVQKGVLVEKGMPIMALDVSTYEVAIDIKSREVQLYQVELDSMRQTLEPQVVTLGQLQKTKSLKQRQLEEQTDTDLLNIQSNLALALAAEETAVKDYQVRAELFEIGSISQKELEGFKQQAQQKATERENLERDIEKLKLGKQLEVDSLQAQIGALQAQMTNTDKQTKAATETLEKRIEIAQIELAEMKKKLENPYLVDYTVVAGGDWIISDLACEKGSKLETIQGPTLKVLDKNSLVIEVDIPEEYIREVAIGKQVKVIPYLDEEIEVMGTISSLSEIVVESYGESVIKVEVILDEAVDWLKPGIGVDVEI